MSDLIFLSKKFFNVALEVFENYEVNDYIIFKDVSIHPEDLGNDYPERYAISLSNNINPYINCLLNLGIELPEDVLEVYNNSMPELPQIPIRD